MIAISTVLEQLTGKSPVDALTRVMTEHFPDFREDRKEYLSTMEALQQELGSNTSPSVREEMAAIEQQIASSLFFSAALGFQANLDHFIDPMANNFLDMDFHVYLREDTACMLPDHVHAERVRDQFYSQLSPKQQDQYEAVITYVSHLETVGPKLAHYYGYILGNKLLHRLIPGYHPDAVQTIQYGSMLSEYLGCGELPFGRNDIL